MNTPLCTCACVREAVQCCSDGSLCLLARLQMRKKKKKNHWLHPIVCRKSSVSVFCFTSLFHYIMQIPARSVWRGTHSSWARQCDSVTVFLPRCWGRRETSILCLSPEPLPSLCTSLRTALLPLALPSSGTLARHQWLKTSHCKFFWWAQMREEHLLEMIFIRLLTHHTFTARTQTLRDGLKWELRSGLLFISLINKPAILSLPLPSSGFHPLPFVSLPGTSGQCTQWNASFSNSTYNWFLL